jgi:hypothetical protein
VTCNVIAAQVIDVDVAPCDADAPGTHSIPAAGRTVVETHRAAPVNVGIVQAPSYSRYITLMPGFAARSTHTVQEVGVVGRVADVLNAATMT